MPGTSHIVQDEKAREAAWAGLELQLAHAKTAGCRELEQAAWEKYAAQRTETNLRTALLVKRARRRAEQDENLARLQLEAVS